MKPEIAKKWVDALRSGNYRQGCEQLRTDYEEEGVAPEYCCLGVLCEVALSEGAIEKYNPHNPHLPINVRDWAGMKTTEGVYQAFDEEAGEDNTLWGLNDKHHKDFNYLADFIEKNVEVL